MKKDHQNDQKQQSSEENSNSASLKQIFKYAQGLDLFILTCGLLGAIVASINWPTLTITFGKIVDTFVEYESTILLINKTDDLPGDFIEEKRKEFMKNVYIWSGATAFVCIIFTFGNFVSLYSFQLFSLRLIRKVKYHYFNSILKQEIAWFDKQNSGEFASRISSDFKKFENGINENLGFLIYQLSSAVFHLVIGIMFGWKLSLVIISISPVMIISAFVTTKLQTYFAQKELTANSEASSVAEEAISAIRTVFAFGGQTKEEERYETKLKPGMIYGCKRNFVSALGVAIHWATIYTGLALGIWYGVRLILSPNDDYTIGQVVIVFWGITGCGFSIGYAAPYYESFQIGKSAAKSIFEVIERQSSIDSSLEFKGAQLEDGYKATIEFRSVHFAYPLRPDVPVLRGLKLKIKSGEIVALVGPSGCGKSTTIQLIQRFYNLNSGTILLDGKDISSLNVGWLRGQLGVVGQEPVLFDASIEENIRLGAPMDQMSSITKQDVIEAAEKANAHQFIKKLPNGYATYVGDRGTQLSGGQKQRIAIARALISKPKILLLDEATSALDLESEHIVQAALDRASQNCTTIIVAHRLSTIKNADRIFYLDRGQVMEEGNHETLMAQKGYYYALVEAQQVNGNSQSHRNIERDNSFKKSTRRKSTLEIRKSTGTFSNPDIKNKVPIRDSDEESFSEDDLKKLQKFSYLRLFRLLMEDKFYFIIAFVSALIYGMSTPVYALIFGEFVDIFARSNDHAFWKSQTVIYASGFIGLAVAILFCCTIQITLFGIVGEKLTRRLRKMAYSAILNQDISFFDEQINSSGALCARLTNDAANVQGATGLRVSTVCQAFSTVVFSVTMGFYYNWRLSLVALGMMPVVAFASMISSQIYSNQAKDEGTTAEKSSKTIIEVMNSIRTVVSLHKEEYFFNQFNQFLNEHFVTVRKKCVYKGLTLSVALGAPFFAYTINFIYGGYLLAEGLLKSGDFFKIAESIIFGALVVGQSAVLSSDFTKAKLAALNIFNLIDRKKDERNFKVVTEKSGDLNSSIKSKGNVSFRGVYFSYPSRPEAKILKGLSFSAHQGETVALVGSSGCGKSTSIQLLERFYDCSDGKVLLDGQNIQDVDLNWLRRQMSLVCQEPILFSYSIKENIAYGDNSRNVPFEDIVRAAKMANVHDFILQQPNGYDTCVGSKGAQLSGGQKQRIAIARALVRDPPILLLDEATSALDTASEQIVQNALDEASKDRTCLVIAHRLKTIVNADKIVVLDNGVNVEEGTHDELIERHGQYWKLYNSAVG